MIDYLIPLLNRFFILGHLHFLSFVTSVDPSNHIRSTSCEILFDSIALLSFLMASILFTFIPSLSFIKDYLLWLCKLWKNPFNSIGLYQNRNFKLIYMPYSPIDSFPSFTASLHYCYLALLFVKFCSSPSK